MYILFFIFLFYFFFCVPVENFGYICDFTSEKLNLKLDKKNEDVICHHVVGDQDTIGVIVPKQQKEFENFHIITKCFNEVALKESGDNIKPIYNLFGNNEIEISNTQETLDNENRTFILKINHVQKGMDIHCVFENRDPHGLESRRGIVKLSIKNHPVHYENHSRDMILDLFKKLEPNVDIASNIYHIYIMPGSTLYILGTQTENKKNIYFNKDECFMDFEKIDDIYKYAFPLINEQEIVFNCSMYYEDDGNDVYIGLIVIKFQENSTLENIDDLIIEDHIKKNVYKQLNKFASNDVSEDTETSMQYAEQSIDDNKIRNGSIHSKYLHRDDCNNDRCRDFFDNSSCSAECGEGYRLLNGYNIKNKTHIIVPCNNGECKIEDEIEPLVIFTYASIVFFCIIITIFTIMIYFLLCNRRKKISDPFVPYDSNLNA